MTYIFTGKVMPERANVNIDAMIVKIKAVDAGFSGEAVVSVSCSQISVKFDTTDINISLSTLKNYVEDLVRVLVDAYGYLSGRGYDVEVTSVIDPNGKQTVFGVGIEELEKAKNERPLSFQDIVLSVIPKSPHFRPALGDLREAIRSPSDTGFFCYRAVECVRQHFVINEDNNQSEPSWKRLRDTLRIDRSWISPLERFSVPQRHGASSYMSKEDRVLLMQRTWKVIDRFCVYVNRGFKQLPEDEFGILKEV
ncbi:MAG: hypothetical protein HQ588_04630 [Deltaproteobacteria bacterium]|nr:hypothetical protein [Deltaproteobacteria bacterium]